MVLVTRRLADGAAGLIVAVLVLLPGVGSGVWALIVAVLAIPAPLVSAGSKAAGHGDRRLCSGQTSRLIEQVTSRPLTAQVPAVGGRATGPSSCTGSWSETTASVASDSPLLVARIV